MTNPISAITPIAMPSIGAATGAAAPSGSFGDMLSSAIQSIETQQNKASDSIQKFLTGENEELHTTVLATQQATLAFELGLQVRNKVVDAYQEIMKMQM
jgi:flagellar hook-basal body complex protein FliE